MGDYIFPAVMLSAFITLLIMITGVVLMGRGGQLNKKYSNLLMRLRVFMQFFTIFLLIAGLFLYSPK